jgi:hypothetical protein
MKEEGETYLGDGLYASFDGYQIKLRAPRDDGDSEVFLDSSVFTALEDFASKFWRRAER